jgi:hypothetical protein
MHLLSAATRPLVKQHQAMLVNDDDFSELNAPNEEARPSIS